MSKKINELILSDDGSKWFRMDLHLHSPAVETFILPGGLDFSSGKEKNRIACMYIDQLKKQEIKIGAVTDYQQVRKDWFELIQREAEKEGIYIFPGVELSLILGRKIHILLIFEYNEDIEAINKYILSLDQNPQQPLLNGRNHKELNLKENLNDVLYSLKEKIPCVIIFPHPSDDAGMLRALKPREAARYLKLADGIEYIDERDREKIISTGLIKNNFFDSFAIIESSDPKSIEEIGTKDRNGKVRTTYIKLSSVSVEALRIALHDPGMRINIYNKPDLFFDHISSIKINGKFLKNIEIDLNREMTTIIGGRGVGKSAVIEALRYVLDLPVYSDKSFRIDFVNSVVGSGGKIIVNIERFFGKKRKNYSVERVIGDSPKVYNSDSEEKLDIEPEEIFGEKTLPIIIGQKELYFLSLNTDFQLHLIDELIGKEIIKENSKYNNMIEKLNENGEKIIDLEKKLEKKQSYEQRLKKLKTHIKTYEELKVAGKLQQHTDLIEDEKELKDAKVRIEEFYHAFKDLFTESDDYFTLLLSSLKSAGSELKEYLSEGAFKLVEELKNELELNGAKIKEAFEDKIGGFEGILIEWSKRKEDFEEDINRIKRELERQGLSPDIYEGIIREKLKLIPLIKKLNDFIESEKRLLKEREKIKNEIKKIRHDIFKIRDIKIDELNGRLNGRLRVELLYKGNKNKFSGDLKNLIHSSNIRVDSVDKILELESLNLDGIELSEIIRTKGVEYIANTFGLTNRMSERLCDWFKEKNRQFRLESLFPDDKIVIKLKVGDKYKALEKLSAGQKATALLLLLFAHENRILVLDQPEEDLDNRFIYEDVVKILREMKEKRQIIMVTHNANIPVLGDSELIVVLNATNDYCNVEDKGSIDRKSIRENVKNIMEGGEEAFKKRAEKYGGL